MNPLHAAAVAFVAMASGVGACHAADAVLSGGIRSAPGARCSRNRAASVTCRPIAAPPLTGRG